MVLLGWGICLLVHLVTCAERCPTWFGCCQYCLLFVMIVSWVSVVLLLPFCGGVIAVSVTGGVVCCSVLSSKAVLAVSCGAVLRLGSCGFL